MNKDIFMLCKELKEKDITDKHKNQIANIKFDGERIIAVKQNNEVILMNRGGNIVNQNFKEVVEGLRKLDSDFIIDGEIISLNDDFTKLMTRARVKDNEKLKQREKDTPIKYMVFDIIKCVYDVRDKPLMNRVDILNDVFKNNNDNSIEIAVYDDVMTLLNKAKNENREGIIIKDKNSLYESRRSENWLKVKFFKEEEFKAIKYEENNKGIKVLDKFGRSVQISGGQHYEVKNILDIKGKVLIEIQYLTKSKEGNYRFPSYKRIVGEL